MTQPSLHLPIGQNSNFEAKALIAPLLDAEHDWGIHLAVQGDNPVSVVARWIEMTIMHETYDAPIEVLETNAGPSDDATVWALLVHHPTGSPVGSMRCVLGPPERYEFTNDLDEFWGGMTFEEACAVAGIDPGSRFMEGGSFSVFREWRSSAMLWPIKMMSAIYMHLVEELSIDATVQVVNPVVKRAFGRYGTPFVSVAPVKAFGGVWGDQLWDATISIATPNGKWFRDTRDLEFRRLFLDRDTSGRNGTRLPDRAEWAAVKDFQDRLEAEAAAAVAAR